MMRLLSELCLLNGISGDESRVREYIIRQIEGFCEYKVDNLGNIIAFKKGELTPGKRILVSAHMDEVGFIVNYINDDGNLKISSVGGIEATAALGKRVLVGESEISGVIGSVAVHNLSKEEREKSPSISALCVDIGAENKEEAEKFVNLGDSVCFEPDFQEIGNGKILSKAIDDRFGCAVMIKLLQCELKYDTYFTFVVQEETGLRGAKVAAYTVNPDVAVVLEATTASDIPGADNEKKVCVQGNGPVVSFMDRSTIYSRELYKLAFDTAKDIGIPCQTKTMIAGGNDAGAIHTTRGGVKTIAVSLPCRYIHSPSGVADVRDIESSYKLVKEMLQRI
ncbi:MAG: M42 family metallopeptidase [Ruminococcus sp.]|nr:M42 family metallopeptidase [Ruminococcus sp.]